MCDVGAPKDPNYASWLKSRAQLAHEVEILEERWIKVAEELENLEPSD